LVKEGRDLSAFVGAGGVDREAIHPTRPYECGAVRSRISPVAMRCSARFAAQESRDKPGPNTE